MLTAQFAMLAVVLVAVALAASSCGSSKGTSTTATSAGATTQSGSTSPSRQVAPVATGKPLTRAQWIAQGDAICARTNKQLETQSVSSAQQFAQALPKTAGYERTEFEQLKQLVPPPAMRADWREFLAATQQWVEDNAQLAQIAKAGGILHAQALVLRATREQRNLASIAGHDGFKECSQV